MAGCAREKQPYVSAGECHSVPEDVWRPPGLLISLFKFLFSFVLTGGKCIPGDILVGTNCIITKTKLYVRISWSNLHLVTIVTRLKYHHLCSLGLLMTQFNEKKQGDILNVTKAESAQSDGNY